MRTNLRAQLNADNNVTLTDTECARVLNHRSTGNVFDKAETLHDRMQVTREDGSSQHLQLLNTVDWCQN